MVRKFLRWFLSIYNGLWDFTLVCEFFYDSFLDSWLKGPYNFFTCFFINLFEEDLRLSILVVDDFDFGAARVILISDIIGSLQRSKGNFVTIYGLLPCVPTHLELTNVLAS